jgi:hypothetical protein
MDSGRPVVLREGGLGAARWPALPGLALPSFRLTLFQLAAHWEVVPLAVFALLSVLVYVQAAPVVGLPFDDSYISLQFARNLADHGFITFDGEHASAGATSLLHVALLSLPIKLGIDPVRAGIGLGVTLHVALAVAVYWLGWTVFRDRLSATLAGASVAIIGYLALDALNGMETTLFLLVTACACAALFRARDESGLVAAGVLGALAVLTRPEGIFLVGAMGLYYLADPRRSEALASPATLRRLAALVAPGALALLGLALFYQATTGQFTPGTATAKLYFFREFEAPLRIQFDMTTSSVGNFVAPLLPWLALAAFSIRRREALLFAFFWLPFIVMYFALFPGGLTHYWYRYQHVFLPAIAVFGAGGAVSLLRGMRWRAWDLLSAGVIGVVLVGAVVLQYNGFRNHYADDVTINEHRQVGLAKYLRDVVPPGATIATHDIGTIGYFSDRAVIDLVGLIEPDVVGYHEGRQLREYVERVQPDYIAVFMSWEDRYLHLGLRDDPATYEQIASFDGKVEPIVVFRTHY